MKTLLHVMLLCLPLLCGQGLAQEAAAEDPAAVAQARSHYLRGEQAYLDGDYDIARAEFEKAYRLVPRPALLYNLARVAMRQKRKEDALGFLGQYLATDPSDAEEVKKELNDMDPEPPPVVMMQPVVAPPVLPARTPPPVMTVRPSRWPDLLLIGMGGAAMISGVGLVTAGGSATVVAGDAAGLAQARTLQGAGVFLLLGGAALAAGGTTLLFLHRKTDGRALAAWRPVMAP